MPTNLFNVEINYIMKQVFLNIHDMDEFFIMYKSRFENW